jgi:hypothetical protein
MGKGRKVVEELLRNRDISPEKTTTHGHTIVHMPCHVVTMAMMMMMLMLATETIPFSFRRRGAACTMYVEALVPVSQSVSATLA